MATQLGESRVKITRQKNPRKNPRGFFPVGDPKSPLSRTSGTSWGTAPESELLESLDSIIKNVVSVVRQVEDEASPTARIKPVPTP